MTFKAASTASSNFKRPDPVEVGTYPARLVQMIDLGVQTRRPYKGEDKEPIQMIRTTYELTTEFMKNEDGTDDTTKPRWISEAFPLYPPSADRSKCAQRYLALDPSNTMDGDWDAMLGQAVALTIVHNPKKDDPSVVYANIGSTSPIMKGMVVEELANPTTMFSTRDPVLEVFNGLPEFLQEKIKSGVDFEGSALEGMLSGGAVAAQPVVQEPAVNPFG